MTVTENHCVVAFEYEVREAGSQEVVDSNKGSEPLEIIMGQGQIIPGLESALVGMKSGDTADVMVEAKDAYGEVNPEAKQTLPKEQFEGIELEEGMTLYGQGEQGQTMQVTVVSFNENEVVVDFNHPMAGKDLMFSIEIKSVREASDEELQCGTPGHEEGECCGSCGCH